MAPEAPERQPEKKPDIAKKAPAKNVETKESEENREVKRKADRLMVIEQARTDSSYKKLEDYLATNYGFDKGYYRKKAANDVWPSITIFLDDNNVKISKEQKNYVEKLYGEWIDLEKMHTTKHLHENFNANEIERLLRLNWQDSIYIGATTEKPTTLISTTFRIDSNTKRFNGMTGAG